MLYSNGANNTPLLAHYDSTAQTQLRVLVSAGNATGSVLVHVFTSGGGGATFDVYHRLYFSGTTGNFELTLGTFDPAGALLQCDVYMDGSFSGNIYTSIATE